VTRPTALDIVVVTFNSRNEIGGCLESLRAYPPPCTWHVVVVDNGSTDDTAGWLRAHAPDVTVVAAGENLGFAGANNVGVRRGRADAVLLLNPDTLVRSGSLETLLRALSETPRAAAAGPRLVDAAGRAEISWGPMIGPFNELRQKVLGRLYDRRVRGLERWVDRQSRRRRFVDWVSGACLLVWRADAEAVGLLDERYFMYTEDVDFCAALRARERRVLYAGDAGVTHLRGRSRATRAAFAEAAYRRSQLAFYEKHHPRWVPWLRRYLRLRGVTP
jgi:N-acetylglucosaminyl-diphospho-decaprenol L-rhamnosyltransferase